MALKLYQLPQEILYNIFLYVPPTSIPALQLVCRRFNDVALPILWRFHCRTQFKYWDPRHDIESKILAKADKTDWRNLFAERYKTDRDVTRCIDRILARQTDRLPNVKAILESGYDAKDTLLRHLQVGAEAEDVLARRFYSARLLSSVHRAMAIQEWLNLRDGKDVPLEKALGSFDMFVLDDRQGDYDEIKDKLDEIAEQFRCEVPDCMDLSTRRRASALAEYLKSHHLVGIQGNVDAHYHDLRNNFIGIALLGGEHPSLPLVSVAIYCCIAQRLGIDAQPCGFPFSVLAIVRPPDGQDLNGHAVRNDRQLILECMYMDPFRSTLESSPSDLTAQLVSFGIPQNQHSALLGASSTVEIVHRSAKNILTSVRTQQHVDRANGASLNEVAPDADSAFHGAFLAIVVLFELDEFGPRMGGWQRARHLPDLLNIMVSSFPMNVPLISDYILPLFEITGDEVGLRQRIKSMHLQDLKCKVVRKRTPDISRAVRYKVGQLFRHKRYHYHAVITGWDVECLETEDWMSQMGVHTLSRGKYQSFYHVLREDKNMLYVAEENIEIVERDPSEDFMALAGQHFKRWDKSSKRFISNIKDEYPDD